MRIINTVYTSALLILAVLALCLTTCSSDPYGAKVTVENIGAAPLYSVVVRVTGNSYPIGELLVGSTGL